MQKRLRTIATLAAAAFATVGDAANIPQEWAVEVSRVRQYQFQATHGDTMALKATYWHNGEPFDLGGDTFRLYWQTNAMGSVYWSAPATAASNTVSAVFANTMDPGAPIVYGFLGATSGNYRASFSIRYAPGPGATPNALPLPAATIDFAKVEVLNPPYYTKAETDARIIELSPVPDLSPYATKEGLAAAASSGTNYTDSTASTLRDDISTAATLTPIHSDTPTFSEWMLTPDDTYTFKIEWVPGEDIWAVKGQPEAGDPVAYIPGTVTDTDLRFTYNGIHFTATRTRTDILGYTLGDQTDKPLQPQGDYAPATNITKSALAQDVQASLGKADTALQTAPVTSVNGQTGTVVLKTNDIQDSSTGGSLAGMLSFMNGNIQGKAPLDSPAFTGTPTAPTPASGDDSTKVATTEFVQAAVAGGGGGIWDQDLEVWWTPVMANGSLTYQATTNVNLNAGH